MATNTQNLLTFTIPPSGTYDVDINLGQEGVKYFVYQIDCTYAASANPTGVTCNVYTGNGGKDPLALVGVSPYYFALPVVPGGSSVPDYGGNAYPVTMNSFTVNKGSTQTVKTQGYLNVVTTAYGPWVKFRFTNTDPTNTVTVVFSASI